MRGSIEKRSGPQGIAYRVRVEFARDPVSGKRRQRSQSFTTKKEAEKQLAAWLTEIERGTAVDTTKMTVAEFLSHWLDTVAKHKVRPTTFEDYTATINNHLILGLGSIPVQRLSVSQVQEFYTRKRDAGTGDRTIQLCHLRLSQALKQGVKWGTVSRNFCDAVDAPRSKATQGKTWTTDEAKSFLDYAAGNAYDPLWLLALTTGARLGELLGLRWQDVDLTTGTLKIRQAVTVLKGKATIQEPKSKAAKRSIGVPPEAISALREHKDRQAFSRKSAAEHWTDHDLVFATATGGIVHPSNVTRAFAKVTGKAGVPRIRFHDLRHTHATWLLADGQPITTVSERLGHAKSSITLDTYAHVVAATRDRAAEAVGALLFGSTPASEITQNVAVSNHS